MDKVVIVPAQEWEELQARLKDLESIAAGKEHISARGAWPNFKFITVISPTETSRSLIANVQQLQQEVRDRENTIARLDDRLHNELLKNAYFSKHWFWKFFIPEEYAT